MKYYLLGIACSRFSLNPFSTKKRRKEEIKDRTGKTKLVLMLVSELDAQLHIY